MYTNQLHHHHHDNLHSSEQIVVCNDFITISKSRLSKSKRDFFLLQDLIIDLLKLKNIKY